MRCLGDVAPVDGVVGRAWVLWWPRFSLCTRQVVQCSTSGDYVYALLKLVLQAHIKAWEAPLPHAEGSLDAVQGPNVGLVVPG